MRFVNKSSVIGLVVGAILSPLIIVGGFYLYLRHHTPQVQDVRYAPPEIPSLGSGTLDWTVQTLDGGTVILEKDAEGRVVFLNFWATWCPPCIAEAPSIENLYRKIGDRVTFACISSESIETLEKFRKKTGYTFPMYSRVQGLPSQFVTGGIPATFILGKDRRVLLKHVGGADWSHPSVVDFLEEVLTAETEEVAQQKQPSETAVR